MSIGNKDGQVYDMPMHRSDLHFFAQRHKFWIKKYRMESVTLNLLKVILNVSA